MTEMETLYRRASIAETERQERAANRGEPRRNQPSPSPRARSPQAPAPVNSFPPGWAPPLDDFREWALPEQTPDQTRRMLFAEAYSIAQDVPTFARMHKGHILALVAEIERMRREVRKALAGIHPGEK